MIFYNIKQVFRGLLRNARYSGLSILGFTIGLAVCIMIAMHIYNQFTYDYCFENHKRIYRIVDSEQNTGNIDYNLNAYLIKNFPEVEAACPIQLFDESLKIKSKTNFIRFDGIASTTNDFFKVFSINALQKMGDEPFVDDNSVVITQSLAKELFGDNNPIGEMVVVDDDFVSVVTAVVEDLPAESSLQANVFINSSNEELRFFQEWQNRDFYIHRYTHFILFNEKADIEAFTEKLNGSIHENFSTVGKVRLQELTSIYLSKPTERSINRHANMAMVYLFIALGVIVLIVSVINYLNFNILLKLSNLKEVGVRKIVGAKNKELIYYSFTEVCVYLLLSLILAGLLITQLTPFANAILNVKLSLYTLFNPIFMAIIVAVLIPVIIVSGLVPFLFIPRTTVVEYLSKRKTISGKLPLRSVLTIAQFAVSILLFAVVMVVAKQINFVKTTNLGFDKEQLLCINLPYGFEQSMAFKQRIEQTAIQSSVSLSRGTPGFINNTASYAIEDNSFLIEIIYVDYDFVNTMGIELLMGRDFIYGERGNRCIINHELYKRTQWDNIENRFLWKNLGGGFEVVGVAMNFHTEALYKKIRPVCLIIANSDYLKERFGFDMNTLYNINIKLTPGDLAYKMQVLQNIWAEFIPDEPMDYFFYDSHFDSLYREEESLGKSLFALSVIAILLTCFGLLGQIMHDAFTRTKEIGIRKVNGAKIWEVMVMLNKDFVKWVGIAFVLATPIAWYAMDKWLQNFAYRTELSWWIFALAGMVALAIALLTVSWQSWRAARKNPVEALRYE